MNNMEIPDNQSFENRVPLEDIKNFGLQIENELAKVIVGQETFIELLTISLLSQGHVLIEGVPGIAKTVTAKLFAKVLKTHFSRIQFTPDLMPSDILGTTIFNSKTTEFEFKKGPIFSHIVLIDEINRSPAKTQAALFEVMEERQITLDGNTYPFEPPFMVLATQNPIEQEGTYALPEAQLDRFLFKIKVDYPTLEEEITIINGAHNRKGEKHENLVEALITKDQINGMMQKIEQVVVENNIIKYIASIVHKTRQHSHLFLGASPRASIAILKASKTSAALDGRDFVLPTDIKKVLKPILNHRIILTPEREMEGIKPEQVIDMIVQSVEIPR